MIARRSFLQGMLAAASGPAIVRASSLMPIKAPEIIVPSAEVIGDVEIVAYGPDVLYKGEIGRYDGIRIIDTVSADREAMTRELMAYGVLVGAARVPSPFEPVPAAFRKVHDRAISDACRMGTGAYRLQFVHVDESARLFEELSGRKRS